MDGQIRSLKSFVYRKMNEYSGLVPVHPVKGNVSFEAEKWKWVKDIISKLTLSGGAGFELLCWLGLSG